VGIDEYVEWARRVGATPSTTGAPHEHLAYLALGLGGEAGEACDVVKRSLRDGTLDARLLAEELGDVVYYWARLCAVAGVAPALLLDESRRKIEARLAARRE
jgi:NTP pyrophosphatase (non-canonical NTP hydrolase)